MDNSFSRSEVQRASSAARQTAAQQAAIARLRKRLTAWLLQWVTILLVGVMLFPLLWLYMTALRPEGQMFGHPLDIFPREITFENFRSIWNAVGFQDAFRNSLVVASVSSLITTVISMLAAFSLSRFRYPLKSVFSLAILGMQMLPGVLIVVPLIVILRQLKLTNTLEGLVMVTLMAQLPVAVWMLKGYMDEIPKDFDEAALIDGASYLGVLWRVVLPLILPAIVAIAAFAFILSWGEYVFALSLITSTDKKTLPLALQAAFGQYTIDWGMLTAGGVIISLPPTILFVIFQRYLVGGLTAGGVKG
jgi:ABC-type glycerol-3-phosphate transport system permease component